MLSRMHEHFAMLPPQGPAERLASMNCGRAPTTETSFIGR
jgi:hypothetical protein